MKPGNLTAASRLWPFVIVALLLVAYALPWPHGPVASLTMGGYDLAEWTSLHPAVWAQTPTRLTTLLLRLPLTAITLFLAFAVPSRRGRFDWSLAAVLCAALVVAQLPPLEFLTVARGDSNYQQQMVLAVLSAVGAVVGLGLRRNTVAVALVALFAGAAAGMAGALQAQALMRGEQIEASLGIGAPAFVVVSLVAIIIGWVMRRQGK